MGFFDVGHELSDVAVKSDIVLNFKLFRGFDKTSDENFEDAAHDLALDAPESVQSRSVGRRGGIRIRTRARRTHVGPARQITSEIRSITVLRNCVRRLARTSFLI